MFIDSVKNFTNKLLQGNSEDVLKGVPDGIIDCCITSPPYWNLRNYDTHTWEGGDPNCNHDEKSKFKNRADYPIAEKQNSNTGSLFRQYKTICECGAIKKDYQLGTEPTFDEYVHKLCNVFDEVKRVLKESGTCFVNLGDTYMNSEKSKANGIEEKSLCLIPFNFALEMQNRGWLVRNVIIWHKPNAMPSSAVDRFNVDFEYIFFFTKNKKYYFERQLEDYAESTVSRMEYPRYVKGSKTEEGKYSMVAEDYKVRFGKNKRTVWSIATEPHGESHFAIYPSSLIETPIKGGCPQFICKQCGKPRESIMEKEGESSAENTKRTGLDKSQYKLQGKTQNLRAEQSAIYRTEYIKGYQDTCECHSEGYENGLVLDPFMGSGTTAIVARKLGRNFLGCELNPEYIKIAEKRMRNESVSNNKFF